MLTVWAKHLKTDKERVEFLDYLRKSRLVFDRLQQLIKEEEDNLNSSELTQKAYAEPNWDYLQAHKNGYRQCLNVFKRLTNLDQKDIK